MKKLWQKDNNTLNAVIESFETKDDIILDQKLVSHDVKGSIAHAKMLSKIGILTKEELQTLEKGFSEILELEDAGKFQMEMGDEDIHTKIENFLTEKYGEVGKKIHTGRSRNDQVLTALRLYGKEEIKKIEKVVSLLINAFQAFEKQYGEYPMPGYTHMQKAMPSSVSLWAGSFISALQDNLKLLEAAHDLLDQSPLGSGAGYGVPITIDKKYTAELMGFSKVQENPIYCQLSRGTFEAFVLSTLVQVLLTVNKFASDVMLFTTQEFAFFGVSSEVTTGSSMMPQKKNLDLAELLRSKVHVVLGNYVSIVSISSNLPSGYNRDLQETKKPFMESLDVTFESLTVVKLLLENLVPQKNKLEEAMTEDLYATEKALKKVLKGESFRDAYVNVGKEYTKKKK